jgi:hypothetical protein
MENVIENNTIIAEFMGAKIIKKDQQAYDMDGKYPDGTDRKLPENMEYHTSWDWLMTVVEKIKNTGEGHWFEILVGYINICKIGNIGMEEQFIETEEDEILETVYNACVEFIEWHNKNK